MNPVVDLILVHPGPSGSRSIFILKSLFQLGEKEMRESTGREKSEGAKLMVKLEQVEHWPAVLVFDLRQEVLDGSRTVFEVVLGLCE